MRIQILLNAFALDGPGRLVAGLTEQWRKVDGVSVRVAALARGGPLGETLAEQGIPTEIVGARGTGMVGIARRWARGLSIAAPPDILHTHLARPDLIGPLVASRMRSGRRPKVVSTNHGLHAWWEKGAAVGHVYSRLYRWRQGCIDRIVGVSRTVAQDLEEAGIARARIQVIPNGVDPEVFRPPAPGMKKEFRQLIGLDSVEGFLILLVGNLIALKGHVYFLRALPEILKRQPDTRVLLVGEGPLEENLRTLARRLGVERVIKRVSPLTVLLPKVMGAADVLVHPSLSESFGLVVAEAQACGLPVVATNIGGPSEIVSDGETGYLVPAEDPGAIARAVIRLASNTDIQRKMGMAGRQRVLQLYDIRRCAADYLKLFRSLTR